jgi:NAD(P)-dependent dehydrogenase (short-subunit alcohol dehydrogenase family)
VGKFDGQVALITGAAHGLGASHALHLAREGANVVAVDLCHDSEGFYKLGTRRELEETVEAVKATGVEAVAIEADVRSSEQVGAAVERAVDQFGRIDILCNNAGICIVDAIDDMSEHNLDLVIDVCLKGTFHTVRFVAPIMKRQRFGKIINTTSIGGLRGVPYVSHYGAAKGGVVIATQCWANELAEWEINVNAVAPGTVLTGMITGLAEQQGIAGDAAFDQFNEGALFKGDRGRVQVEDISRTVVFLASEDARMITGQVITVDAGWMAAA